MCIENRLGVVWGCLPLRKAICGSEFISVQNVLSEPDKNKSFKMLKYKYESYRSTRDKLVLL